MSMVEDSGKEASNTYSMQEVTLRPSMSQCHPAASTASLSHD